MGWPGLKRIVQGIWEGRTSLENPQTPLSFPAEWALDIFSGGRTDSGLRVSELTALQVPDVLACVTRISGAISGQPIKIFERIESGERVIRHSKRLAVEHPLFDILRYRPNDEMTRATFIRTYVCHLLLWGNGYAEIQRDQGGRPVAIWPRNPVRTRPRRLLKPLPEDPGGNPYPMVYITTEGMEQMDQNYAEGVTGVERIITKENMLHVPGLSLDARLGQDTVWLCRQAIGLSLAAEKYAAKYFGNGTTPTGVLETPNALKKEARDALRNMWMESQGGENIHRVAVLENGLKFTKISALPSEAQMVEARKQQRAEIAAIFGMPITMLGETGASRANAEQVALEFVNYTLKPWVTAIEEEFKVKLFEPSKFGRSANRTYMALIDLRNLELPAAVDKQRYYSSARQWGWENANGILELEDQNPIPGTLGESYLVPVNMTAVDADGNIILQGTNSANKPSGPAAIPGQGVDQPKTSARDEKKAIREALWPAFRDAFGRIAARQNRTSRDFSRIFRPILESLAELDGGNGNLINAQLNSLSRLETSSFASEQIDASAREVWAGVVAWRTDEARVYLARHGETENDVEGASDDYHPEEPLNEQGRTHAAVLAGYVRANLSTPLAVYSGSPVRHQQTASRIENPTVVSRLDPQGKDESEKDFARRTIAALDEIRSLPNTGSCLAVTSHKAIRTYAEHIGAGLPEVTFCSLWDTGADGKSIIQIFSPGA